MNQAPELRLRKAPDARASVEILRCSSSE